MSSSTSGPILVLCAYSRVVITSEGRTARDRLPLTVPVAHKMSICQRCPDVVLSRGRRPSHPKCVDESASGNDEERSERVSE